MSTYRSYLLPVTLALGLSAPIVASAQQPAPPPSQQMEGGWRKFSGPRPAEGVESAQGRGPQADPQQGPGPQADAAPPAAQAQPVVVPNQVVVPAGTWLTIRVNDVISTEFNRPGDAFTATLSQPLIADGIVLARRGQTVAGRVVESVKGGVVKGTSRLGLELTELGLADGHQVPLRTQLVNYSAGTSRGRDATAIATTTGVGAAIGAAADGGFGAGVGALAGAAASTIGVLATRGRNTEVFPEAAITFRLIEPLTVDTGRSAVAFRAVGQQDYEPRLEQRPPVRMVQRAPMYAGWGYGYPYYSSFWYGPGYMYYGGPRFYSGGYYGGYRGGHHGRGR